MSGSYNPPMQKMFARLALLTHTTHSSLRKDSRLHECLTISLQSPSSWWRRVHCQLHFAASHLNFSQYLCISISDKLFSFQGLRRTWSCFKWSHYSHSLTSLPHWWVLFKHVLVLLIPYFPEYLQLYNGNALPTQITSKQKWTPN